jgi:excisionase family DNA binding protein
VRKPRESRLARAREKRLVRTVDKSQHRLKQGSLSPLVTVGEGARLLGLKDWTMRQWISQRRFPYIKVGRLTKLRLEDISAFIEANRKEAVAHD